MISYIKIYWYILADREIMQSDKRLDFMSNSNTSPNQESSLEKGVEVKNTTCYMCACRCGIRVTLRDGEVRYIQGNPDHPLNKGVICAKGSSGIMKQYSPARLTKPLRRKPGSDRGAAEFEPTDSANEKILYLYRLFIHDKMIQPLPESQVSQKTMKHKLAIWYSKQLPKDHPLLK